MIKKFASFGSLLIISIFLSIVSPQFLTVDNLLSVGLQISVIALLAIGELLVIITGGIDLSVGSILAFSGVMTSLLLVNGFPISLAILVGLLSGLLLGFINGLIISKGKLPPFIATLGMMGIARGASLIITNGIPLFGLPYEFSYIANSKIFDIIPIPVIIVIIMAILVNFLLKNFSFGRYTYALGGNFEATRLAGVKVDLHTIKIYSISGLFSGLGGIILASRLSTGQPTAGTGYELDVIAACVIGGASLSGGSGTILGAMIGALIIGILRNGCNLLNISAFWQQIAIGAIIIIAVFIDQYKKKFNKE
ncbi:MAG TPA: ABC transporter permease [Bacteroidota bacterium]|jgi:ribose transport system permease protein|nr:ABC transporter permease [Bacteroidota bacterium]